MAGSLARAAGARPTQISIALKPLQPDDEFDDDDNLQQAVQKEYTDRYLQALGTRPSKATAALVREQLRLTRKHAQVQLRNVGYKKDEIKVVTPDVEIDEHLISGARPAPPKTMIRIAAANQLAAEEQLGGKLGKQDSRTALGLGSEDDDADYSFKQAVSQRLFPFCIAPTVAKERDRLRAIAIRPPPEFAQLRAAFQDLAQADDALKARAAYGEFNRVEASEENLGDHIKERVQLLARNFKHERAVSSSLARSVGSFRVTSHKKSALIQQKLQRNATGIGAKLQRLNFETELRSGSLSDEESGTSCPPTAARIQHEESGPSGGSSETSQPGTCEGVSRESTSTDATPFARRKGHSGSFMRQRTSMMRRASLGRKSGAFTFEEDELARMRMLIEQVRNETGSHGAVLGELRGLTQRATRSLVLPHDAPSAQHTAEFSGEETEETVSAHHATTHARFLSSDLDTRHAVADESSQVGIAAALRPSSTFAVRSPDQPSRPRKASLMMRNTSRFGGDKRKSALLAKLMLGKTAEYEELPQPEDALQRCGTSRLQTAASMRFQSAAHRVLEQEKHSQETPELSPRPRAADVRYEIEGQSVQLLTELVHEVTQMPAIGPEVMLTILSDFESALKAWFEGLSLESKKGRLAGDDLEELCDIISGEHAMSLMFSTVLYFWDKYVRASHLFDAAGFPKSKFLRWALGTAATYDFSWREIKEGVLGEDAMLNWDTVTNTQARQQLRLCSFQGEFSALCAVMKDTRLGLFFVVPIFILALRTVLDTLVRSVYPLWAHTTEAVKSLEAMDAEIVSWTDPHGYFRDVPLLQSSPAAIGIMQRYRRATHSPLRWQYNNVSPLVATVMAEPVSAEARRVMLQAGRRAAKQKHGKASARGLPSKASSNGDQGSLSRQLPAELRGKLMASILENA